MSKAQPSVFARILVDTPHPRLKGVALKAGERYALKLGDAEILFATLSREPVLELDAAAGMVNVAHPGRLAQDLAELRADVVQFFADEDAAKVSTVGPPLDTEADRAAFEAAIATEIEQLDPEDAGDSIGEE